MNGIYGASMKAVRVKRHKVAILIPTYYNIFSQAEKCAVQQCLKILAKYPVFFIIPNDLEVKNDLVCEKVQYVKVPKQWMDSIESYSKMLCSIEFYERFIEFEYVLIYQLDAFVFQDRLQDFCEAGYDYYGAPWLYGSWNGKERLYVGNGGFSLRRTQAVINLLETEKYEGGHEDTFFGGCKTDFFRVAPIDIALEFAFETDVRKCYIMNNKQLPFGCHAWEKWDYSFWEPFIEREGYHLKNMRHTCESAFKQWIGWDLSGNVLQKCIGMEDIADREIYIWGTKAEGFECGYLLRKIGIAEFSYIDNDSRSWGNQLWGKSIIPPARFDKSRRECTVIIAAKAYEEEIAAQLGNCAGNILYYSIMVKSIEAFIQQNFLGQR